MLAHDSFRAVARIGAVLFGLGLAALGVTNFIYSDGVLNLEPVPAGFPGRTLLVFLSGALLVLAGLALVAGKATRIAAAVLSAVLGYWVLLLQLPRLAGSISNGGYWTATAEALALACGALVVAVRLPALQSAVRMAFAACLIVFAALHVVYRAYVASVIPVWIPGHMFWTFATALAFLLAAGAIATRIRGRLGATLLGVMSGSWVLIVHVPRVLASPTVRPEWTSLLICLAMSGASLAVAASLPRSGR